MKLLFCVRTRDSVFFAFFNFTKGTDNWDPITDLIANDPVTGIIAPQSSSIQVYANGNRMFISNVKSNTRINVYGLDGSLFETREVSTDTNFVINKGLWIVKVYAIDGDKVIKVLTH